MRVACTPCKMTLRPSDSSYREERDRRAIESEFVLSPMCGGEVDADMAMLRERMQTLGKKEKQWAEVCQQFVSLSMLTGIQLVDGKSGEPTGYAWLFLAVTSGIPLYLVFVIANWLHTTSVSFSHLF